MKKFNAIDLFAGAGGLSHGLERAGFNVVLANELESDFCETYRTNHPNTMVIEGDVRKIDFKTVLNESGFKERIHLIAGGPPCQGFSTVGKKQEDDPRNDLFMEFIKTIEIFRPDFVLFENVSGFKRMYEGRIFDKLRTELDSLGYDHKYAILNAVNFGLPQQRQRTIVVAYAKGLEFEMPEGGFSEEGGLYTKPYRTLRDAISDLPEIHSSGRADKYKASPQNDYQKEMRGKEARLTEHFSPNHGPSLLNVISKVPPGGSIMDIPEELRPKSYFANTYARLLWDKPTPTMTRNFGTPSSSRCIHPELDRGLSTREGARLQGFPDGYVFCGKKGSKNLQIGNAVPPIFGFEIGKAIHESLAKKYKQNLQESDACV